MGSKFCNLNVYGGDLAAVEAQCPGLAARAVVPGWITAAGDDETDWGEIRKLAKRMSRDWTVLYTEYFNDDYVDFSVYRDGRRAARHVPAEYEGAPRAAGKPRAWAELFGLSPEMEKALRTVFQETSPERSLRLLECVLGCPLWVDGEFLADAQPPEPDYLRDYLARKAVEKKIRNATKLTLLDEQEGDFHYVSARLLFRQEAGNPNYWEDGDRKSVWAIREGKLRKLFERELPGAVKTALEREGVLLVLLNQAVAIPEENTRCTNFRNHYWAWLLSEDGTLRDTVDLGGEDVPQGIFLDRDQLFLNRGCYDLRTRRWEWLLEEGLTVDDRARPCRLAGGRLALRCYHCNWEEPGKDYLITLLPDGSERVAQELPRDYWDGGILAYGDGVLLDLGRELVYYDAYLAERWRMELPGSAWHFVSNEMRLDETTETLYLDDFKRVLSIDLKRRQIRAERKPADREGCYLEEVLPGVGAVMLVGDSTLQVWDADLKLLSRHRAKGDVTDFICRDGKAFIVTDRRVLKELRRTENGLGVVRTRDGCVWLYELKK